MAAVIQRETSLCMRIESRELECGRGRGDLRTPKPFIVTDARRVSRQKSKSEDIGKGNNKLGKERLAP